jgi:hypothetical protein
VKAPIQSLNFALLVSAGLLSTAQGFQAGLVNVSPTAIEIHAEAIATFDPHAPARRQFGQLEFRGGLILKSNHREFGGLSALRFLGDGKRFISLTDHGAWFTGSITYDGVRPVGIAEPVMAPILAWDGRPLAAHGWRDTESIAVNDGILYVGIEGANQVVQFDFAKDGLLARGHPIAVPSGIRTLPKNRGLEALEYVPQNLPMMEGTLVAISERALDGAGNIRAFFVGGPTPGTFAIKRKDQFDITDVALLPSGELLILERSLSWPEGLLIQIRRIPLKGVKPDVVVDGPVLFEADLSCEIDNMEGLAVHQMADGAIVLTFVSDDNFSPLQRTELLQFTLVPERTPAGAE